MEIMMRRCGSAAVMSVAPQNYEKFLKDVLKNRHGWSTSKEANTIKVDPKAPDSSHGGRHQRKRKESSMLSKEDGSVEPRKRREDKRKGFPRSSVGSNNTVKWAKGNGHSDQNKLVEHQSESKKSKRKRNMRSTKVSKISKEVHGSSANPNKPK